MNAILEEARIAIHVVWRRRWLALAVAWGVALTGWLVISLIPNAYQSSAKIYIEPQSILPQAVGISGADQQNGIDGIRQTLLSGDTLSDIVRSTDLARQARNPRDLAATITRLQSAIDVRSPQDNLFTIATTLSGGGFSDSQNAHLAQQVTQKLVDRFVAGSASGDAAEARRSLAFMDSQLAQRGAQLQDADQKRAEFEQRFFGALPGTGSIADRVGAARSQLADIDSQLAAAQGSAAAISGQLASTPATIPGFSGGGNATQGPRERLAGLQAQLAADQAQGWTDQHPDVVALRSQIARLQGAASAEPVSGTNSQPNPAYASLRAMQAEKQATAAALGARRAQIQGDLNAFAQVQATQPQVASQQAELSRNYDVMKAAYDKLLTDRESVKLRADAQASGTVQVRVLDQPTVPRVPAKPKRPLLLTGVLLLAIVAGAGAAWLRAKLTTSYSTPAALVAASGLPVLGAISFVRGEKQKTAGLRQLKWFAGAGGALVGAWLLLIVVEFVQRSLIA